MGGDHDSDLFYSLSKLVWLDSSIVVQIKILESSHEHCLFVLVAAAFLGKLGLELSLKTKEKELGNR